MTFSHLTIFHIAQRALYFEVKCEREKKKKPAKLSQGETFNGLRCGHIAQRENSELKYKTHTFNDPCHTLTKCGNTIRMTGPTTIHWSASHKIGARAHFDSTQSTSGTALEVKSPNENSSICIRTYWFKSNGNTKNATTWLWALCDCMSRPLSCTIPMYDTYPHTQFVSCAFFFLFSRWILLFTYFFLFSY